MRSSLARFSPVTPMQDDEIHRMAQRIYHEKNKVLVDISELTGELKQGIIEYADRKYGKARP